MKKKISLPFEKSPLILKWRGDFPPANPNPRLDTEQGGRRAPEGEGALAGGI